MPEERMRGGLRYGAWDSLSLSGNEAATMRNAAMFLLTGVLTAGMGVAQTAAPAKDAAAAPAASAIQTEAVPALWKVKGAHGTVYLFGSVHVMKKEVHWETAKVKDALGASDTLYLEIAGLDEDSVKAAQPEIMELGIDQAHPLSTKISKEDVTLLDDAVKAMGLPGEAALEPMQPWLVYLTISVVPMVKAGYDPNSGIDRTLEAEAKAASKPVKGFETMSEQMHYFSDMAMPMQVEMLHQSLVDLPKSTAETDTMVGDWTKGDVDGIGKLENDEMKTKYPDLYKKLLVDRNKRFAETLAGVLKDPATGTVFVAVGAAHLAGPDSIQKMLESKGYSAVRVE
jgi:uncharacterized protein YbaP (TraB family)